jgi:hypothetical protein
VLEPADKEAVRLDGSLVIWVSVLELADKEAVRLDGSLVIRVAALGNLSDASASRLATKESVSCEAVR